MTDLSSIAAEARRMDHLPMMKRVAVHFCRAAAPGHCDHSGRDFYPTTWEPCGACTADAQAVIELFRAEQRP